MSWIEPVPASRYELRVVTLTDRERRALIQMLIKQREAQDPATFEPLATLLQKLR